MGLALRYDCLALVGLRGITSERDRSQLGLKVVGRPRIAAFHEQYGSPFSFGRSYSVPGNADRKNLGDGPGS